MSTAKSRWNTADELPKQRRSKLNAEVYRLLSDTKLMLALYDRYSLDGISQLTGVSRSTVQRYLTAHGAEFRPCRSRPPLRGQALPDDLALPDLSSGRSAREQVIISLQRAYLLADRCARPHCTLACDPLEDDCELEERLRRLGELERRPWEPEDYKAQWARIIWSDRGGKP